MGKGMELVLKTLRAHFGDEQYTGGGLRQNEIRHLILYHFDKSLSRERIRQLVNSLVHKGLVKKNVISKYNLRTKSLGNIKTFSIMN